MTAERTPGQSIAIASVPNLRDLGGWPTQDGGRVRWGLLYRSTELGRLAGADMATFAALGIRSVYDLRTEAERTAQPDRLPPGTEYVVADVVADSVGAAPAQLFKVVDDPQAAEKLLGGGRGQKLFAKSYRGIVSLPSANAAYHRLFHCTTGKDRTGWAAASLLLLLGVPEDLVMQEYLLTNTELLPAEQPLLDRFKALGGDPDVLLAAVAVAPEYLEAALDEMRKEFGGVEAYFSEALGLDTSAQQALRAAFVEPT